MPILKIRIYTVHYGEDISTTVEFVEAILPLLNENSELIILNNSINVNLQDLNGPKTRILNAGENLGYFGGVKFGIEKFPAEDMEYIIICNNDTQILSSDFFRIVEQKLKMFDVIGPSIRTLTGSEQNPHREVPPSAIVKIYYRIYFASYLAAVILTKLRRMLDFPKSKITSDTSEKRIFSAHGAFIIIGKEYFNRGGYIDDGFFLYGEEDSMGAISQENNIRVGYCPELKVLHKESKTIGKGLSRRKYKFQRRAYKYIRKKYKWFYQ